MYYPRKQNKSYLYLPKKEKNRGIVYFDRIETQASRFFKVILKGQRSHMMTSARTFINFHHCQNIFKL